MRHYPPFPQAIATQPLTTTIGLHEPTVKMALERYYQNKIEAMKLDILKRQEGLRCLKVQRNDYNTSVRLLREELGLLRQRGS